MKHFFLQKFLKPISVLFTFLLVAANVAQAQGPKKADEITHPLSIVLLIVIVGLLIAIIFLGRILLNAAFLYIKKGKEKKQPSVSVTSVATKALTIFAFVLLLSSGSMVMAQQDSTATATEAVSTNKNIAGLSPASFYTLVSVIVLELLIIFALLYFINNLLSIEKKYALAGEVAAPEKIKERKWSLKKWWQRINRFKPVQEEAQIDLGHDYDGIRELDNRLPPWWLYGFYFTIIFAVVYLWRYHVAHSAPLSHEEYEIAVAKAEKEKQLYLAKAADNIDENTVKLLTDASDIEAGKKIFQTTCAACHSADGGGGVGPNLTDDYWIHGGSIQDIFKTIKYGWPEKGMQSWKDMYSPKQIAQLASYIKTLRGTKPATPKEPQGELYKEETTAPAATDSSKTSDSTLKVAFAKLP
jgi:cytochrome c oxidase cbb3-type subunit 3